MNGDDDEEEDSGSIGVARYPCMPSLVALQQMRNRLQLAHLGRKLMKWTALATGKELRRLAMELDAASKTFHDDCKNAFILLARCRYCFPAMNHFVLESVPHHPKTAHVKVSTTVRNVTAVKCIMYNVVKLNRDPYEILMVARGGEECQEARAAWFQLLLTMISWLQLRTCYQVAEAAHLSATKKHKVLGKVVIPKINDTIAYILSEMEERAREEFFRMKKIIQIKAKRRKMELIEEPAPLPAFVAEEEPNEAELKEEIVPIIPPESTKKPCHHVCVKREPSPVVSDISIDDDIQFIPEEPEIYEETPVCERPEDWGSLPGAKVGVKTILVPKTTPPVTPKASLKSRPSSKPLSTRPSVRITVPTEGEELVEEISTYEEETVSEQVSKITTFYTAPPQPLQRTIEGPVCGVCNSCRPRPQCKHKVFDGKSCNLCQTCCKTPSFIAAEQEKKKQEGYPSRVIIIDQEGNQQEFIIPNERLDSEISDVPKSEDTISIDTIGTIGDLSLDEDFDIQVASTSYTSDPIYKIESSEVTKVRKITKIDGTVIEQREVTRVTMETVPEDLERLKSREINEQIADLQKYLCKNCTNPGDPILTRNTTAFTADIVVDDVEEKQELKEQEVKFSKVCDCAKCDDPDASRAFCTCKTKELPDNNYPIKCSYEWSCGGEIPECSVRKKNKLDTAEAQNLKDEDMDDQID